MISQQVVWILEDDPQYVDLYQNLLSIRYEIHFFSQLKVCLLELKKNHIKTPHLLIGELNLKEESLLKFLSEYEKHELFHRPVLIVTMLDDLDAFRFCLDKGINDVMSKPFQKAEFVVRVERMLKEREKGLVQETGLNFTPKRMAEFSELTFKELQILSLFLHSTDNRVKREEIIDQVWGAVSVQPKTLDVHLYNLRKKIHRFGMSIRSEGIGVWSLIMRGANSD